MNFLFITWKNDAGQLAWQVRKEGHNVKVHIDYKSCRDCYDGLLEKVRPWQDQVEWADVIIFDEIGFAKKAQNLRDNGKKVIGGTRYTDNLEWNREFGQREMERLGMKVLAHWEFNNFDRAIAFISSNPRRYVFKPQGVVSSADHNLLFVGQEKNGRDLWQLLKSNQKKWRFKIKRFMLQEYAGGVEIAVGGFFNGYKFLFPICVNQEYKRLFPGNVGPLTNDMGALVFWSKPNEMYARTLAKIEKELARIGYVGYFDVNCIANKNELFPLEFTARFGYPTIDTQLAGIGMPAGEFLFRLANGENFEIPIKSPLQIGICGVLPTFIHGDSRLVSAYRDSAIFFDGSEWDLPGLFFKDVKLDKNQLRVAGESKFIGVATGSGRNIGAARRQAYKNIRKIKTQDMFYRSDIGENWRNDFALLKKFGYLKII